MYTVQLNEWQTVHSRQLNVNNLCITFMQATISVSSLLAAIVPSLGRRLAITTARGAWEARYLFIDCASGRISSTFFFSSVHT